MSREHDVFQSIDRLQWARDPIRVAHALKFVQIEDVQETILNFHDTSLLIRLMTRLTCTIVSPVASAIWCKRNGNANRLS